MNNQRESIRADYVLGLLTPQQIALKYRVSLRALQSMADVGDGTELNPVPWQRCGLPLPAMLDIDHRRARGLINSPDMTADLYLPPLEALEKIDPLVRDNALELTTIELDYCNAILRGATPKYAAMLACQIDNPDLAVQRAMDMEQNPAVGRYLASVKTFKCIAVQRDRYWLESVIVKIIDRSMGLRQSYDAFGVPIEGQCEYNPNAALAAAALLSKIKGWDKGEAPDKAESFADKIKKLALQRHRVIEHVTDSDDN